jgi:hypothetical protein
MANQIPERIIEIETISKSLYDIFQTNEEGNPIYFDSTIKYEDKDKNILKYRIPPHQRYGSLDWKDDKKCKLVDSIFKGYPIQGLTTSKHTENNVEYLDIEDGATRLTILQDYYNDGFKYCDKLFSELENRYKLRYNNYKINIDIMNGASPEDICYAFDRLNSGKSLSDADRFYAIKDISPFVKKAIELMTKPFWNKEYMKTETYSSNKRKILPELCAIVATLSFGINYTSVSSKRLYEIYFKPLSIDIDTQLENFFIYYNKIIKKSLEIPITVNGKIDWHKTSKILGLILHDFLDTESIPNSLIEKAKMWHYIITLTKTINNFMFGNETIWNGLNRANKHNCLSADFKSRLIRIRELYNIITRNETINKYGIITS